MGRNAFAHKGGMHVAGVTADPATFEHIDPAVVGNRRELLISELSGKGTVHARARDAGHRARRRRRPARVIERVKELEHRGYHYEAADGSFELLLRKETGDYEPLFRLESWRAIVEKRADGRVETEATIKIWVDGERYVRTAEGNGPVNALDRALRDALVEIHPASAPTSTWSTSRSASSTRPRAPARSRACCSTPPTATQVWGSIGVSENVIEASWEALVDSLEYGMQVARRRGAERSAGRLSRPAVSDSAGADPARPAGPRRARRRSSVLEVLRSGRLSLGPAAAGVRAGLRRAASALAHASAVSSGTAGLHLALRAVGRRARATR